MSLGRAAGGVHIDAEESDIERPDCRRSGGSTEDGAAVDALGERKHLEQLKGQLKPSDFAYSEDGLNGVLRLVTHGPESNNPFQ